MAGAYEIVRQAILDRDSIAADYDGYPREMSPHVIGINKQGRQQALFYQYAGGSKSGLGQPGSRRNWRCIEIVKLGGVRVIKGVWETAPNHTRPQTCVNAVDLEVAY